MSKESPERGLGVVYHGGPEPQRTKAESATKRGRFVPDAPDWARLRESLHGNERRMT